MYGRKLVLHTERQPNLQDQIGVRNRWQTLALGLRVRPLDSLVLELEVPFVENERVKRASRKRYGAHGLGDVALAARYYPFDPGADAWNVYGKLGLSMPTGDSDKEVEGQDIEPYIQAGAGVWAPGIGAGLDKALGDFTLAASAEFLWMIGENDADYDLANPFYATLGGAYRLRLGGPVLAPAPTPGAEAVPPAPGRRGVPILDVAVGVRSLYVQERGRDDDVRVGNTGGWWVHLVPGVAFTPDGGAASLYLRIPFPVYVEVNSLQTIEDYGVEFGASYRF